MKRAAAMALAAMLLIGSIALISAQQNPTPENPEPVYPSTLPDRYLPILERSMFGFYPRESAPESQAPAQQHSQASYAPSHDLAAPGTLPGFQHDPGLGRDIPAGPAFSLTAVVEVDGRFKAIVADNASGDGHYVAAGDSVASFTVESVARDRVVLKNGGEQITLKIDAPRPQAAPGAGTAQGKDRPPAPEPDYRKLPPHIQPRIGR